MSVHLKTLHFQFSPSPNDLLMSVHLKTLHFQFLNLKHSASAVATTTARYMSASLSWIFESWSTASYMSASLFWTLGILIHMSLAHFESQESESYDVELLCSLKSLMPCFLCGKWATMSRTAMVPPYPTIGRGTPRGGKTWISSFNMSVSSIYRTLTASSGWNTIRLITLWILYRWHNSIHAQELSERWDGYWLVNCHTFLIMCQYKIRRMPKKHKKRLNLPILKSWHDNLWVISCQHFLFTHKKNDLSGILFGLWSLPQQLVLGLFWSPRTSDLWIIPEIMDAFITNASFLKDSVVNFQNVECPLLGVSDDLSLVSP